MSGCYSADDYCWIPVSVLDVTFEAITEDVLHHVDAKILLMANRFFNFQWHLSK